VNQTKEQAARQRAAVDAHNRKVRARIPLYTKAILECKALAIGGQEITRIGEDCPWPAAFAPLTLEEKRLCRDEAAKKHQEANPDARIETVQVLPTVRHTELPR
jgi:hypothetical protein